jgi:hypothetical protein
VAETFTCPRCASVSHHPEDVRHGYCGACHDYTAGEPAALQVKPYGSPPAWPDPVALFAARCWRVGDMVVHTYPVGAADGTPCHCGGETA